MTRLAVKDMPDELANAALEMGYDETHEMTRAEAIMCWSEWEIGDPLWATHMMRLLDEFDTDVKEQT